MTTRKQAIAYCLTFSDTYEDYPFHDLNWTCMRIRTTNRIFAWTYEAVVPAYHMNKKHWNSLILDGTIPEDDIKRMIAESYDLCAKKQK